MIVSKKLKEKGDAPKVLNASDFKNGRTRNDAMSIATYRSDDEIQCEVS